MSKIHIHVHNKTKDASAKDFNTGLNMVKGFLTGIALSNNPTISEKNRALEAIGRAKNDLDGLLITLRGVIPTGSN